MPRAAAKSGTNVGEILIPMLSQKRLEVTIEGVTPLIVNRFGESAMDAIEAKQQKLAVEPKAARDPKAEMEDKLHKFTKPDGSEAYGVVANAVKLAVVSAGGRFAGQTMTHLRGALMVLGQHGTEYLEILSPHRPQMRRDKVNLAGGTASIAYRPMFTDWSMVVPVLYLDSMYSEEQVVQLLDIAGMTNGIGDWRPEKDGNFGMFRVREYTTVEMKR